MADPKDPKTGADPKAVELTAAQAARAVKRPVPEMKDGKPTGETKLVAVREEELLAWSKRGDRVTVVTRDGQKFEGAL